MTAERTRKRLDRLLTDSGLARSRSHARDLIRQGHVSVNGETRTRPGAFVDTEAELTIGEAAGDYVSRGAVKLAAALDAFGFECAGVNALDIGASTGGFTQVLLQRGAARVTAVDVGRGQLHMALARDPHVIDLQGFDARQLTREQVPEPATAIVADVSFISVTKVLPAALALASPGCWLVVLVKPQFEAGREHVGKGGVVRDEAARELALGAVRGWLDAQEGWRVVGAIQSPIRGQSGNLEFLIGARYRE